MIVLLEKCIKMPPELIKIHHWIDETVDSLYRSQPFETDGERLMWLKNIYNQMIENEQYI